jgi:hypothetical protein
VSRRGIDMAHSVQEGTTSLEETKGTFDFDMTPPSGKDVELGRQYARKGAPRSFVVIIGGKEALRPAVAAGMVTESHHGILDRLKVF